MTGLLQQAQTNATQQMGDETADIQTDLSQEGVQQQYQFAIEQGMGFIHAKETRDDVVAAINEGQSPAQGVGFALGLTMARIDILSKNALDSAVLDEVAQDLISEIIEVALAMGIVKQEKLNKQFLTRAMRNAYQRYMEVMQLAGENGAVQEVFDQVPDIMEQGQSADLSDLEDEDKHMLMQLQQAQQGQQQPEQQTNEQAGAM